MDISHSANYPSNATPDDCTGIRPNRTTAILIGTALFLSGHRRPHGAQPWGKTNMLTAGVFCFLTHACPCETILRQVRDILVGHGLSLI